jgi:hypothetical protein
MRRNRRRLPKSGPRRTTRRFEESQARDGATVAVRRDLIQAREGWIVETRCHRHPSEHPTRREHNRLAGHSDYNECKRRSERAQRHHVPPAGSVDPPANRRSCHAREKTSLRSRLGIHRHAARTGRTERRASLLGALMAQQTFAASPRPSI